MLSASVAPSFEINAQDLIVCYGPIKALDISHLQVSGKIIAVIGHNGSGKSTLIKTLLGLLEPRRGAISALELTSGHREILIPERHMAFSPENGAVFADITVESYVRLWCRIKHGDSNYYRTGGASYIEKLDLTPLLPKLGRELSKGQRRRVQTAIGFLTNPQFFLFDEPFDGLDIQQSSLLGDILVKEAEQMSILISSHRMDVVERLADRIIVLEHGGVLTQGTPAQICAELVPQSAMISGTNGFGNNIPTLVQDLKREFTKSHIDRIGNQVSITGPDFSLTSLEQLLQRDFHSAVNIEQYTPSLVDAMNYHLKRMG